MVRRLLLLAACWGLMAGSVYAQTLLTNLELYAKYDDDLTDASGNSRNGTGFGTPTYTTGKINNGVVLNGSTQYVTHGTGVPIASVSKFSYSVWFRATSLSSYKVLCNEGAGTNTARSTLGLGGGGMGDSTALGATVANGSNTYGYTATGKISTATWYHVVMIYDGTQTGNANRLILYLNGSQETLTFVGTIPSTTYDTTADNFHVGTVSGSSFFWDGRIDELGVWSRALTGSEVTELYNSGSGLAYSSFGGGGGNGLVYPQIIGSLMRPTPWSRFIAHTPIALLEAR